MPGDAQFLVVQSFNRARCPGLGTSLMSRKAACELFILCFSDQEKPPAGGTHLPGTGQERGGCKSASRPGPRTPGCTWCELRDGGRVECDPWGLIDHTSH